MVDSDAELAAIEQLLTILEPLAPSARARVLADVSSRLGGVASPHPGTPTPAVAPEPAASSAATGPAWFFSRKAPPPEDEGGALYANGIDADTGLPLCRVATAEAAEIASRPEAEERVEESLAKQKYDDAVEAHYGVVGGIDPNDLAETGWGVVFPAGDSGPLREALAPLLDHRRRQVYPGGGEGELFRVFDGADGYRPGETCLQWLARQGVGMSAVDPTYGVPFYLLLVGSPEEIPFEFHFLLDVYWGVGRLHFDDLADYRRYAESVVAYETAPRVERSRSAAVFATEHPSDRPTRLFAKEVARPLAVGERTEGVARPPLGEKAGFAVEAFIGESATKSTLTRLLRGRSGTGPPSLLLTGSHGMGCSDPDDARIEALQGALICQDWTPWQPVSPEHRLAAADLPEDARIHGLVHFFFACYSAGCPMYESCVVKPGEKPPRIAPRPFLAELPRKMLAHPRGGALAVLGHVDRAWATSFRSPQAVPQLQGFRDVMERLLRGDRVGQATDQFDVRRAALSAELIELRRDMSYGRNVPDREITSLWIARNDAQGYLVLGDPGVRLRVEEP